MYLLYFLVNSYKYIFCFQEWVNRKFDNKISDKMFTKRVGKVCENKRKYKARKVLKNTSNPRKQGTKLQNKLSTETSVQGIYNFEYFCILIFKYI